MTRTGGNHYLGAIEGGGTRFVCALADSGHRVVERTVVTTRDPAATLGDCLGFFRDAAARRGPLGALGIACFGPLGLRPGTADHGRILATPKPGWSGVDVTGAFREAFRIPVVLQTDVGAAALGEWRLGAGRGKPSLSYVTVGTGIGGATVPAGAPALLHAEMGHLPVRRDPHDAFAGTCPFHGDCLEGLAAGPAVRARWGRDLAELPADHEGRALVAGYVAQLAAAIALIQSPECLVIGGGVTRGGDLLPEIRRATHRLLGDYLPPLRDAAKLDEWILAPGLGQDSAIAGALLMAAEAAQGEHP